MCRSGASVPAEVPVGISDATLLYGECGVRRDDIDMIGSHRHVILGLEHRHAGGSCQQIGQDALVLRREVLDENEGHARVSWHASKKRTERRKSARRGADPDNQAVLDPFGLIYVAGHPVSFRSLRPPSQAGSDTKWSFRDLKRQNSGLAWPTFGQAYNDAFFESTHQCQGPPLCSALACLRDRDLASVLGLPLSARRWHRRGHGGPAGVRRRPPASWFGQRRQACVRVLSTVRFMFSIWPADGLNSIIAASRTVEAPLFLGIASLRRILGARW
jgi:hypothetical protein